MEEAFDLIASRWNSETFNPTTMVLSCHYDFLEEIDIGFDATHDFARATPTKVKDKLAKMKSDLTSIIQKWERSGQGDGGRIDEEDDDMDEEMVLKMQRKMEERKIQIKWWNKVPVKEDSIGVFLKDDRVHSTVASRF